MKGLQEYFQSAGADFYCETVTMAIAFYSPQLWLHQTPAPILSPQTLNDADYCHHSIAMFDRTGSLRVR